MRKKNKYLKYFNSVKMEITYHLYRMDLREYVVVGIEIFFGMVCFHICLFKPFDVIR